MFNTLACSKSKLSEQEKLIEQLEREIEELKREKKEVASINLRSVSNNSRDDSKFRLKEQLLE